MESVTTEKGFARPAVFDAAGLAVYWFPHEMA
jgi:hypothetical protein